MSIDCSPSLSEFLIKVDDTLQLATSEKLERQGAPEKAVNIQQKQVGI